MNTGEDNSCRPAWRRAQARAGRPIGGRFGGRVGMVALAAMLFTACAAAPEPMAAKPALESAVAPLAQSTNVIYVMPVEGLENPLRLVLADAVAAALRDSERPAILADTANNQGPTIVPAIEQVRERGSVVWVTTRWKLRAPYGTVVAERQREMVIDKQLWERKSVETVNLIIDDAMPAVAAMVHDYVGPLNLADAAEPASQPAPRRAVDGSSPMPDAPPANPPAATALKAEPAGIPVLGRTEAAESLPPEVGAPAPPENIVLDLPATAETEQVPVPGQRAAASRPPTTLAPPSQTAAEAMAEAMPKTTPPETIPETMPETMPAQPEATTAEPQPRIAAAPDTGPKALSAPPPPETMSGIKPSPRDTPVRWGKPSFLIRTVEGAPGDGNRALASAITAALRGKDITVTEDPRQAGYEVVGKVDVGPAVNGRQRARISWAVNTIGGQEVGKAVQENVVAAGSLDGSWGQVAVLVSSAAANGIQQLFEAPRPKYTPVGSVPPFPKIPNLPRVPGRALPPPS